MKHYNFSTKDPWEFKRARKRSLERLTPNLFKKFGNDICGVFGNPKTVLNIGAHKKRFDFKEEFLDAGYQITVLEPFKPSVEYLKTLPELHEVVLGDVRDLSIFIDKGQKFDVVFWWHGPEHIVESDLRKVFPELEKICNYMIVLGCPWGYCPQGVHYGNKQEEHVGFYDYKIFEEHGYTVECLGKKDVSRSNITSVKELRKNV